MSIGSFVYGNISIDSDDHRQSKQYLINLV